MSIQALGQRGWVNVSDPAEDGALDGAALFFSFDTGYLMPFKVMLHSMARAGVLTRNPIIICTDDPRLLDDPMVKVVADKIVLLEGIRRDRLYALAETSVRRPERANWNRGTFLKWAAFDDHGVDRILFLDVDMIVMRSISGLAAYAESADLVACPQFQESLARKKTGRPLPTEKIRTNLRNMLRGEFSPLHRRRINSGVMLFGRSLASNSFQKTLLDFASSRVDLHEQAHLSAFFQQSSEFKLRMAPSAFNFHESFLGPVPPLTVMEMVRQIRILHYPGKKPWDASFDPSMRLTTLLWWKYRQAAEKNSDLFSPANEA